jgi:hypothetical protein
MAFSVKEMPTRRVRAEGRDRPHVEEVDVTLLLDLDELVVPVAWGDPRSPLRWTLKPSHQLSLVL